MIFGGCVPPAPAPAPPEVKPIEIRLAHYSSPVFSAHFDFIVPWSRKVEDLTNGRLKITIYAAASLVTPKEAFKATKAGVTDWMGKVLGEPDWLPLRFYKAIERKY